MLAVHRAQKQATQIQLETYRAKMIMPREPSQEEHDNAPVLRVYIASHCPICDEAERLARAVAGQFPRLIVEVIDLDRATTPPSEVFAVPTYVLNRRICFLGNPEPDELCALLESLLDDGS
ncbi:MAG: hypothetical protein D6723_15315 [Acidobacteria bacterium]|nr:MAG: hypothetical protein D6723_15315 [Acidobacteriota bacterium]